MPEILSPVTMVVAVPAPSTIQAALIGGAVPGTILAAPLAPKEGPIIVGVAVSKTADAPGMEPLYVVAGRLLWSSPTAIAARRIFIGLALIGAGAAGMILKAALDSGVSVWALPWGAAGTAFVTSFALAALTTFFLWLKTTDHNIVVKVAPKSGLLAPEAPVVA